MIVCLIPLIGPDMIVRSRAYGHDDEIIYYDRKFRRTKSRTHGGYPIFREER